MKKIILTNAGIKPRLVLCDAVLAHLKNKFLYKPMEFELETKSQPT